MNIDHYYLYYGRVGREFSPRNHDKAIYSGFQLNRKIYNAFAQCLQACESFNHFLFRR